MRGGWFLFRMLAFGLRYMPHVLDMQPSVELPSEPRSKRGHIPPSVMCDVPQNQPPGPAACCMWVASAGFARCVYKPKPTFQIPYLHSEHGHWPSRLAKPRSFIQTSPKTQQPTSMSPSFFALPAPCLGALCVAQPAPPHPRSKPK